MVRLVDKYAEKLLHSAWENANLQKMLSTVTPAYLKVAEYKSAHTKTFKVSVPVICVGNLTIGGAGKTPLAIKIAKEAIKAAKNPFFLSRGYKGRLQGVIVNKHLKYSADDVGDEALLLSRIAPVIVNKNRYKGAKLAIENGADMLIMDDGFQNRTLEKDFSFLVFDGKKGIGNGFVLPAGPMRETFDAGIKRASAAVIVRKDDTGLRDMIFSIRPDMPVFHAKLIIPHETKKQIEGKKCLVATGIGNPEKFVTSLTEAGAEVVSKNFFPDHHFYTEEELSDLCKKADNAKLEIVITEKDAVKIPGKWLKSMHIIPAEITFDEDDEQKIRELIGL